MIVSGGHQKDSAIHIHVSILPQTPLPSRLPYNGKQSSLCWTAGPCWLSILNIRVCTCQFQTTSFPHTSSLATISSFSKCLTWLLKALCQNPSGSSKLFRYELLLLAWPCMASYSAPDSDVSICLASLRVGPTNLHEHESVGGCENSDLLSVCTGVEPLPDQSVFSLGNYY